MNKISKLSFEKHMKEVWFIRHGESASNVGLKTSDTGTIPITEFGVQQAEALAKQINKKPDLIIHSNFLRTLQTAKPTIEKYPDVPIEVLPLHEFDFLARSRCIDLNIEQRKPMVKAYWERCNPEYIDGDGAESFNAFIDRIIDSLKIIEAKDEKFIVVFTHGHVIRAIYHYFNTKKEPIDMYQFKEFSKNFIVHNTEIFRAQLSKTICQFVH